MIELEPGAIVRVASSLLPPVQVAPPPSGSVTVVPVAGPEGPPGGEADLGPLTARVDAVETEVDAHHIRLDTLEASDDEQDDRLLALEAASGDPGAVQELVDDAIETHVQAPTPHPAYDDLPSFTLLFENGLV